jgi:dienelactone hydrolase
MIPFSFVNSFGRTYPRVLSFFEKVRQNEGAAIPIGAVGFCWGGKHTIHLAHGATASGEDGGGDKPLVDAAFTGHPSLLKLPADLEPVRKPLSIAVGDKDIWLTEKGIAMVRRVFASLTSSRELVVYPNAGHGFTVRQDKANPEQDRQATEAQAQALNWFAEHFAAIDYTGSAAA